MNTRLVGAYGEQTAASYLRANGYSILAANYRAGTGEIDIVAEKKKTVCFVEVKTRKDGGMFAPAEAVDIRKQQNLKSAAAAYINRFQVKNKTRFDIIEIIIGDKNELKSINHIEDAF